MDLGQFEFEPDRLLLPALVTRSKYRHALIQRRLGFKFDGAARLFTVHLVYHRPSWPSFNPRLNWKCLGSIEGVGPVTVTTDDYKTLQVCLIYSIYLNGSFYDSFFNHVNFDKVSIFYLFIIINIDVIFIKKKH